MESLGFSVGPSDPHRWVLVSTASQARAEEAGGVGEDLGLGGLAEPVGFAGKEVHGVGDLKLGELRLQRVGVGDGDHGIGGAVQDERGRRSHGSAG